MEMGGLVMIPLTKRASAPQMPELPEALRGEMVFFADCRPKGGSVLDERAEGATFYDFSQAVAWVEARADIGVVCLIEGILNCKKVFFSRRHAKGGRSLRERASRIRTSGQVCCDAAAQARRR